MSITIMDGGMGGEIRKRLTGAATGIWSAAALVRDPCLVGQIHREYIEAGAQMIMTNTYATVPSYLCKEGLEDRFEELAGIAGKIARDTVIASGQPVLIAGSIPPLDESYRPDLVPPEDVAAPIYEKLVIALRDYVDLFICETMSSAEEAHIAASQTIAHGGGKPVYVAWTLNETPGKGLRSGESVTQAFERLADLPVAGFMFNCTAPEAIEAALDEIRPLTDKPLGCYANRLIRIPPGSTLDGVFKNERDEVSTADFVATTKRCIDKGATLVGGCCGIDPAHIAALTRSLAGE